MFLCKLEVEREEMGALTIYAMQQKGLTFFLCWPVPNK